MFVPYIGKKPAALEINGHTLIILSTNREAVESSLDILGADHLVRLGSDSPEAQEQVLTNLAKEIKGGVVISPGDIEVPDLIDSLRQDLPWVQ